MKQLGNLAIVCAQRPDTLLQIHNGNIEVYVGAGQERAVLSTSWDNDSKITHIIHELNYGKYRRER